MPGVGTVLSRETVAKAKNACSEPTTSCKRNAHGIRKVATKDAQKGETRAGRQDNQPARHEANKPKTGTGAQHAAGVSEAETGMPRARYAAMLHVLP